MNAELLLETRYSAVNHVVIWNIPKRQRVLNMFFSLIFALALLPTSVRRQNFGLSDLSMVCQKMLTIFTSGAATATGRSLSVATTGSIVLRGTSKNLSASIRNKRVGVSQPTTHYSFVRYRDESWTEGLQIPVWHLYKSS